MRWIEPFPGEILGPNHEAPMTNRSPSLIAQVNGYPPGLTLWVAVAAAAT